MLQMPVQGGRPTVKTRFSGLRNVLSGISGINQSGSSSSVPTGPVQAEDDEIIERLTPDELVLTKVYLIWTAHLIFCTNLISPN